MNLSTVDRLGYQVVYLSYMQEVGKVTHYYGKIGVAIVDLSGALRVGDTIKIEGNRNEFEQTVDSMQMEHQEVREARAGDVIGLKVREKVNEGAAVYRME